MKIPRKQDLTYLAETNFRDVQKMFGIKRNDRRQHMYILGKSGTGKSALLKNMIIQNIANGEGLAVVDPHGELIEDLLEMIPEHRLDDVVYFNPADDDYHMGFNMLEVPDPKYKHLIASGLMGIFTKIWANVWSSRMEYILNNTILALIETPGTTMLAIPRMLVDDDYRNFIVGNVTDPVVKSFWENEFANWQDKFRSEAIAPIQNKVGQFLSTALVRNIVGQQKSTIDIYDIMNSKKILLVNVSKGRIGEDNSALLGAMMITKIQLAAMERVRIPEQERKDFYLYVDEFQNFVTESFASILSEARKYRLCLTIAHQYIGQLSMAESVVVRDAVFGNVGSMISFRVGATDAEFMEKEFEPEFEAQDFVNLPNYHIYLKLMIDGVTSRPFSAKTLPPFDIEGSDSIKDQIIDRARELYAKPRVDVEREISEWSNKKIRPSFDDIPSDPEEAIEGKDGKYRIKCSLFEECGNIAIVPFKPEKGRPVYCKEHIEKLKNQPEEESSNKETPKNKTSDTSTKNSKIQQSKTSESLSSNKPKQHAETKKPQQKPHHKEIQNNTIKNSTRKENSVKNNTERISIRQNSHTHKDASAQKSTEKLSLSSLQKKSPSPEKDNKIIRDKEAQDGSKNLLRNAILQATQNNNTPASTPPVQADQEIKSTSSAQDTSHNILKETQNVIEQTQKERENLHAKQQSYAPQPKTAPAPLGGNFDYKEQEVNSSNNGTQYATPQNPSPQPKEVPEDILKKILE